MKRYNKNNSSISIKDLMIDVEQDMYTNQTIQSLSRSFLETMMENRTDAVILLKIKEIKDFQSLLNRLKYTDILVHSYGEEIEGFKKIDLNVPQMENDEFFVIIAERFSACIYWNQANSDNFDLSEGFCSLNPGEVKTVVEHLQTVAYSSELEKDLDKVLQDRRNNEKFTIILRKIVADLENRQRDLICASTELKEVQDHVEESRKLASLSQLFSAAMHEIRNPLGAIDLHAKIVSKKLEKITTEDEQLIEEIQESVKVVRNTTEKLGKILTELLDFSKPLTLEKDELNLEESVNEIISLIKPSYDSQNIELSFKNELSIDSSVFFDRAKFHQVIFNMLKNALEASESGSKVEILLTDEQEKTFLKISDQGVGIPEENREKIFKPYFTTKKEGTGLGLAEARKIVEAHDGTLYVDSETSKGTTFVISLPADSLQVNITG